MREALGLARRARGRTAPNPMVGALVVRGGRRVAGGYTAPVGGPHAEVRAIARAGARTRGAELFVTLEPCAHFGRTPPCVDAVLEAGFKRVVIGMRDPDPRTAGASIRRLRRAGVVVRVGVEGDACRELNQGYLSRLERGRPLTVLKLAASLDGRIATASGESRWITGPEARAFVHELRRVTDAVVVGSGTARADDPALTARRSGRVVARPIRIVVDSRLALSPNAKLFRPPGSTWILTGHKAPARKRANLERIGARLVEAPLRSGHLDLRRAWRKLGALGVNDLLVEGGGGLAAALLRADLVDRLHLFLAPTLIGGDGREVLASLGVRRLRNARALREVRVRRLGPDLLLSAELRSR